MLKTSKFLKEDVKEYQGPHMGNNKRVTQKKHLLVQQMATICSVVYSAISPERVSRATENE